MLASHYHPNPLRFDLVGEKVPTRDVEFYPRRVSGDSSPLYLYKRMNLPILKS